MERIIGNLERLPDTVLKTELKVDAIALTTQGANP